MIFSDIFIIRGGHFTRPDPKNFGFGSGLKPDRIKNYKPDRVVIGSGQTQLDPNTLIGLKKKIKPNAAQHTHMLHISTHTHTHCIAHTHAAHSHSTIQKFTNLTHTCCQPYTTITSSQLHKSQVHCQTQTQTRQPQVRNQPPQDSHTPVL